MLLEVEVGTRSSIAEEAVLLADGDRRMTVMADKTRSAREAFYPDGFQGSSAISYGRLTLRPNENLLGCRIRF
jgi:hypothetical protein